MIVLGIESSCDETGAAVVDETGRVYSDVVQSQIALHAPFGGVIPELASRDHLRNWGVVVREALDRAHIKVNDLDGIAVTHRPGLVGALLVGVQAAKALAWAADKPFVGVDHLVGHLLAVFLRRGEADGTHGAGGEEAELPPFPFIALLASGGHTALYRVDGASAADVRELGSTRDDAAGEAFDKVGKLLGLGYPGGPAIDRLAAEGDPAWLPLSVPMAHSHNFDFSFSGIKTQVASFVREHGVPEGARLADVCASFQATVTTALAEKLVRAARREGVARLVLAGGVAANRELRSKTARLAADRGMRLFVPDLKSCTDNAAMIAYAGMHKLRAGMRDGWDLECSSVTSLPKATRKGRGAR